VEACNESGVQLGGSGNVIGSVVGNVIGNVDLVWDERRKWREASGVKCEGSGVREVV